MEFTLEELNTNNVKRAIYISNNLGEKWKWLEENTDHNIIYMALQGSQTYHMDVYSEEYMSDIDVKAICIPSLEDVIRGNKMVSTTYIMEDNSHIDVKDIRLYVDLWRKSNQQFLEILFSEFYICVNPQFRRILDMADRIAFANKDRLLSCIKGMQMEKLKAMKHPYPTIKDKIDMYGYDPKQLHHIYRLLVFAIDIYVGHKSFREALIPEGAERSYCLELKTKPIPVEQADFIANDYVKQLGEIADNYRHVVGVQDPDEECYKIVDNIIYDIIYKEIEDKILYK